MYINDEAVADAPRRTRWRWVALLVGIILGGAGLFILWQMTIHPTTSADQDSPSRPPVQLPAAYYDKVEEMVAQGLGMAVAQVKAGIEASSREGLFSVAAAQGISADQLHTIEIAALRAAGDQMAATGMWTQQQADATMQYWRQRDAKSLAADINSWFLNHPASG